MEEQIMQLQTSNKDKICAYQRVPYSIISDELEDGVKNDYFAEIDEIIDLYSKYKAGVDFNPEGSGGDYVPSMLRYKKAASIVNKEVRFLFSAPVDFIVNQADVEESENDDNTIFKELIDKVLKRAHFTELLIKGCRDCFIGKRIAIVLNFNESSGIRIGFQSSLNFLYETDVDDPNLLTKLVIFFNTVDTNNRDEQRYFKKIYYLDEKGFCRITEEIYDGLGKLIEEISVDEKTKLRFIPAVIVRNDGLSGETKGESELGYLIDYEGVYSKMANADLDAERKSMNPTRYIVDADESSFKGLSSAPGSLWDIQSDDSKAEPKSAQIGMLEANMAYSPALKITLDRLENAMYSEVDVPNINSEQLQGVITSGKTIRALYWGLSVRCDEKMLTWGPALETVAEMIIEGAKVYPNIAKFYISDKIPDTEYDITVESNYALPEDEQEEKETDLSEVAANTMSRKAYIKKWRGYSDEKADAELDQIMKEKQMFESNDYQYPTEKDDIDINLDDDVNKDDNNIDTDSRDTINDEHDDEIETNNEQLNKI